MKRTSIPGLGIIVLFALVFHPGLVLSASPPPPQNGDVFPAIILTIPEDPAHKVYLGLAGEGQFKIPQIKAEAVIIEVYSMYCPHCQREASRVNQLYETIEQSPKYKGRLKVIGIGVGNSSFEVGVFAKKYKVPFPLFPDADFSIHQRLGEVRTPYFIGVRIKKDGTNEVFYSKLGGFRTAHEFLQSMVELSGLK
ncbi:MAG: redoxin domain-containing protein [Deltaproteobacteria bacterium]|nr:redoxin domain-containing protein [Deltaproteobacteria bacterium]MBW2172151.1 redoxin domain-containing protein [Deltaproteobacteria bacterium]MBW2259584.1 redoxin domain-containing protein [Deltaproteobacteria bacterium]